MIDYYGMDFPSFDQIKGNRIRQDKVGKKSITPLSITGTNKVNIVKVAAYCRVSTDQEGQDESFSIQRKHYVNLIESQPGWELAGIYQERISATNLSERSQLNRLLEDCRQDKVEIFLRTLIQCPAVGSVENGLKQRLSADLSVLPKAFFFYVSMYWSDYENRLNPLRSQNKNVYGK